METTDMQAIREASNHIATINQDPRNGHVHASVLLSLCVTHAKDILAILDKIDKSGEGDPDAHLSDEAYLKAKQERFSKGGLANVDPDKYMEEVRGTGMVLDDIELERCYQQRLVALSEVLPTIEDARKAASEYKAGMMQARLRYLAPAKAPAEVATIEVREALSLGLRVANEIRRTCLPGPINSDVLGAIHTFERAADVILSNTPEHGN